MIKRSAKYFLIFLLSSCSIDLFDSFAYRDILLFYKGYISGFDSDEISQEVFDKYEYSFANVKIGRGAASTVVLAYIKDGVYEWRSNDGIKIYTFNGMIVKTVGFKSDFEATYFNILDEFYQGSEHITYIEFKNPDLYKSATYNKVFKHKNHTVLLQRPGGPVSAEILSHSFRLPVIKWDAQNKFYIYKDSVISSEQFIHPNLPKIKMDFYLK